jgi:hypothetical protein
MVTTFTAQCGDWLARAEIAVHNLRMNSGDYKYIWQASDWPNWRFDLAALAEPMAEVSRAQGLLMGRLADVGMALRDQASLAALTEDVVKTSEIEGEQLNVESVRSSIARRLGVDIGALAPVDRHVEAWSRWCSMPPPTARHWCRVSVCSAGMPRCFLPAIRALQDQRRRLARRCHRPDAGGVRAHRPPAGAFRSAAGRSPEPKPAASSTG